MARRRLRGPRILGFEKNRDCWKKILLSGEALRPLWKSVLTSRKCPQIRHNFFVTKLDFTSTEPDRRLSAGR
jgi:hypothetical protein